MVRAFLQVAAVGLVLTAASGARAATPVTEDNFMLKTTADLVALCGANQADPLYTAAVNYCHGFALGVYRMLAIEDQASRNKHKAICFDQYAMTKSQAIANFLTWAADKPKVLEASRSMDSPNMFTNHSPARSNPGGQQTMKKIVIALVALGFLGGCSDMTATQQRAATGTLGGAAGGAIIGAIAGNAGLGAAIGAGAGLIGGLVYDKVKKDEQSAYQQGYNNGRSSTAN